MISKRNAKVCIWGTVRQSCTIKGLPERVSRIKEKELVVAQDGSYIVQCRKCYNLLFHLHAYRHSVYSSIHAANVVRQRLRSRPFQQEFKERKKKTKDVGVSSRVEAKKKQKKRLLHARSAQRSYREKERKKKAMKKKKVAHSNSNPTPPLKFCKTNHLLTPYTPPFSPHSYLPAPSTSSPPSS